MSIFTRSSLKDIWTKNRAEFLKLYAEEQYKFINHKELEKRFVDRNGVQYYGFPGDMQLPIERWGRAKTYLGMMSMSLSDVELNKIADGMDSCLMNGLKTGKNAAKLGALIEETRFRNRALLHHELLYNYLAVFMVREDEEPTTVNEDIHKQKVIQFKTETENGSYFFFRVPELKNLTWLWNLSEEEWKQQWTNSLREEELLEARLKIYSPDLSQKKEKKTSKKA